MGLNPVTGLNTLNNILRVAKVKIPLDAPVIKYLTQAIMTRELNLYFNRPVSYTHLTLPTKRIV